MGPWLAGAALGPGPDRARVKEGALFPSAGMSHRPRGVQSLNIEG